MGFRIRRSFKVLPGVKININKNSTSITFGSKGLHYTINSKGKSTTTVGIPGTGISYSTTDNLKNNKPVKPKKEYSKATYILASFCAGIGVVCFFALEAPFISISCFFLMLIYGFKGIKQ